MNFESEKEIQNQGSTYEEVEAPEIMESSQPKIPKKLIFSVAGALAVVLLFICIKSLSKPSNPVPSPIASDPNLVTDIDIFTGYTENERAALREVGYTGPEIERFEEQGLNVEYLITEQKKVQENYLKQLYVELSENLSNPDSPEFQELKEMTWVGGKILKVQNTNIYDFTTEQRKEIVDYVKVPARGTQLFIRVTLDNGEYAFMNTSPSRWAQMKDSGNVVITYSLIKYGQEEFVTDIAIVDIQ